MPKEAIASFEYNLKCEKTLCAKIWTTKFTVFVRDKQSSLKQTDGVA